MGTDIDVRSLKKATARLLFVLCEAKEPLSLAEAHLEIGHRWRKLYDRNAFMEAIDDATKRGWLNVEFAPTAAGLEMYRYMHQNKHFLPFTKFFEPCSSPNVTDEQHVDLVSQMTRRDTPPRERRHTMH